MVDTEVGGLELEIIHGAAAGEENGHIKTEISEEKVWLSIASEIEEVVDLGFVIDAIEARVIDVTLEGRGVFGEEKVVVGLAEHFADDLLKVGLLIFGSGDG